MSKLLSQSLKISLLPAATMIVSKLLFMFFPVKYFDIPITIENTTNDWFSLQIYIDNYADSVLINSISNLGMVIAIGIIVAALFTRSLILKNSKSNPRTIVKLTRMNLVKWVTGDDTLFLKVFIWCIFLLAACAITIVSTFNQNTEIYAGAISFGVAIIAIWGLIRTFDSEVQKVYPTKSESLFG